MQRKLRTVKKDTDAKDDSKPQFEPIDYEEELNFSLQTPESKATSSSAAAAEPNVKKEETPAANLQQHPEDVKGTKPSEAADTNTEEGTAERHKVTVMVHRSQQQPQQEEKRAEDTVESTAATSAPPPATDKTDSSSSPKSGSRKNSHATVIQLGPEEQHQQQRKSESQEKPQQVTFKAAPGKAGGGGGAFPLLPPPPPSTSTKMRAGYTQILRPTPASPPKAAAAAAAKDKSMSLPRGLPSDFGEFEGTEEDTNNSASSLNPFQLEGESSEAKREGERQMKLKKLEMQEARGDNQFQNMLYIWSIEHSKFYFRS